MTTWRPAAAAAAAAVVSGPVPLSTSRKPDATFKRAHLLGNTGYTVASAVQVKKKKSVLTSKEETQNTENALAYVSSGRHRSYSCLTEDRAAEHRARWRRTHRCTNWRHKSHDSYKDNPQRVRVKDGQKTPFSSTQLLFSSLRLETSFSHCCLCRIPMEAGNKELKARALENKPSCNEVGEHCSLPITTLLDKSLFSVHNVST